MRLVFSEEIYVQAACEIEIRNLNLVQKQNLGIRNLENLNWKILIESI